MLLLSSLGAAAQYSHAIQAEKLDRGVVAVKTDGGVFVSWRSLVSDDKDLSFDVYRDGVKINESPIKSKQTSPTHRARCRQSILSRP